MAFRRLDCYAACGGLIPTFREYLLVPFLRVKEHKENAVIVPGLLDP
jgi:hypothetical protein